METLKKMGSDFYHNGKALRREGNDYKYPEGFFGGGGSNINLDYSEEEINTGLKWIDGSPIYSKTFIITKETIPSGVTTLVTLTSEVNKIVEINAICEDANNLFLLPNPISGGTGIQYVKNTRTLVKNGTDTWSNATFTINIKYIK